MIEESTFTSEKEAELRNEINKYRSLRKPKKDEYIKEPVYIISTKWNKQWKRYLGIDKMKYTYLDEFEEEKLPRVYPGPINNLDIISTKDNFYKTADEGDLYNIPLIPDLNEKIEYKIINEDQWNFLYKKYGGLPIKRWHYRNKYDLDNVEVYFTQLNLVILPDRDNFGIDKVISGRIFYCSKLCTLKEIKERMEKVINENLNLKIEKRKPRLWKVELSSDISKALADIV